MKLPLWIAASGLGMICALPLIAHAQYGAGTNGVNPNRMPDYYTNPRTTDTMIRNHRARRRMEERLRQKRNGKSGRRAKTTRRTTSQKTRASSTKPVAAPLPHYGIEIRRDSYQDFHREDPDGFKVNFTFTSVSTGKTISKSGYCKLYDIDSAIEGIPAGTYMVRAEVPYGGKIYPAHIGSKLGSDENPKGGDFAPSFKIVLKPIIDSGGSRVMGITPEKIYVRVLE